MHIEHAEQLFYAFTKKRDEMRRLDIFKLQFAVFRAYRPDHTKHTQAVLASDSSTPWFDGPLFR